MVNRILFCRAAAVATLLFSPPVVYAQADGPHDVLFGRVSDVGGRPLSDAQVGVTSLATGQKRKAIAESCKTGWTYILDRATGKPIPEIDPIPEKKVKQVKANNTWPTQPTPTGDSWAAQCPRAKDWKGKKGPDGKIGRAHV